MNNVQLKELETVRFYRKNMLKYPKVEHLLSLEDSDEHKLPAMDKLLRKMSEFCRELKSVGLALQVDKYDQYPHKNKYELTDVEYSGFPVFKIIVKSNWLNPKWRTALHGSFEFYLHVVHDGYGGRYEIADWISIRICHLNTAPISFVSKREHIKTLGFFLHDPAGSYFYDIPMNHANRVSFDSMDEGMTFKIEAFNEAVEDACKVMDKIIQRKEHLKVFTET